MKISGILSFVLLVTLSCNSTPELHRIYDGNGYIASEGKFAKNQFTDTIFVYKKIDDEGYDEHFDRIIVIDSTIGPFYYGTELVLEKYTHKLFSRGSYRFRLHKNPDESFKSRLREGIFTVYERDGNIYSEDDYKIKDDSSYIQIKTTAEN
ncbi:hypothetical protein [Chryseobacterium sp. MFBS3-17]|uniref:hypothetical protein n=1 Tax=Chryseobacterium sp. MFBS3-17 TaxID=2886689 RepID=UPI001D0F2263|nr:hypothetical protein [Chryseobacterium sp. MFBS3-17]MCC2590027.1 hypothetical protein [Chryseobacterium sp. MFBS3-17]